MQRIPSSFNHHVGTSQELCIWSFGKKPKGQGQDLSGWLAAAHREKTSDGRRLGSYSLVNKKLWKIKRFKYHLFVAKLTENVFPRCLISRNIFAYNTAGPKMLVIIKDNSMGSPVGLGTGHIHTDKS